MSSGIQGRPPKGDSTRAREPVLVSSAPPKRTRRLSTALQESVDAASWLRGTDTYTIGLLRKLSAVMDRTSDPHELSKLIPLASQLAVQLGLSPDARLRLALQQVDREEAPEAPEPDYSKPVLRELK